MAAPLATLGILSIGEMGLGVAKLLAKHNYRVLTSISGRSQSTHDRARGASIQLVSTDEDLAAQSDYILSIVPPRDAFATAKRIVTAASAPVFKQREAPLYFLDLNAISPRSARDIEALFQPVSSHVRLVDGGIIGGAPSLKDDGTWSRPSIPSSGPYPLSEAPIKGAELSELLNMPHISSDIGAASGLKMCFASLTKGFTSLAIQSFTTAHRLGVMPELKDHLSKYSPKSLELASRSVTVMPPKAYRWVREMEEIRDTFAADGGFTDQENIFGGVSGVYGLVANGTDLGLETTENRTRGKTAEDVAKLMSEGIERRKVKTE